MSDQQRGLACGLAPHSAPAAPNPGAGHRPDPSPAAEALRALGDAVLLLAPAQGRMPWCSPGAQALLAPLAAGARLGNLAQRLAGLDLLLAAAPPARALLQVDGRALDATLAAATGGRLVLRLAEAGERSQAVQRHLEDRERLLFTSRTVSVGEMATTLAHELNQPIGAVVNLLRGVQMRLAKAEADGLPELRQALTRANEQALFASRIIARIREYTHSRQPQREPFDLARTLHASVQLLDWEMQRDAVRLELDVPAGLALPVTGDEVMVQQVLVNLVRNALDAMRPLPADAMRVLGACARATATHAEVAVTDTGTGMSDEVEQRLFVPFVSTKPSGMGIGLNICRSFVELHQGRLWFSRRSPRGCAFHVALPLRAGADTPTGGSP